MLIEQLKRVTAVNNDVSSERPKAKQDCSDVVNISIFFDGTGNNKETDEKNKKWSNPARLWENANTLKEKEAEENNQIVPLNHAIYVSGVGTKFNAELGVFQRTISWMQDSLGLGLGAGAGLGGARRLNYGEEQFNDHLKKALELKFQQVERDLAKYAAAGKTESVAELQQCLAEHRLIKKINISVFGFSRGAALARAFTNQMIWNCNSTCDGLTYGEANSPIEFQFLGLFDTVASFGLPSTNLLNNMTFKGRDMVVDERVKMCVHHVAGNEQRFAFPVDLICKEGTLANQNWKEVVYPGMHSDVGGGYMPLDEKTQITDHFARIPLRDMLKEAVQAGVRMYSYEQLEKDHTDLFKTQFEIQPQVETLYQSVVAEMQSKEAAAIQVVQARNNRQDMTHFDQIRAKMIAAMKTYYSAYGTIYRNKQPIAVEQTRSSFGRRVVDYSLTAFGPVSMAEEIRRLQATQNFTASHRNGRRNIFRVLSPVSKLYEFTISIDDWEMSSWEQDANQAVTDFYQQYVHDSKYGFLLNAEPFSYFYQRTIFEPRRSGQGQQIDLKVAENNAQCRLSQEEQQEQLSNAYQRAKLEQETMLDAAS